MATATADRNLLFGILALQMDFISRDALIQAMNAWILDKAKGLGQILVEQKALGSERDALLEALVQEHLKQHDNDTQQSLAAVSSIRSVREELDQIADPELHASLAHVSVARPSEVDSWATHARAVGASTSEGLRFRILRPHARGGLGEVFVALDEELHREVALKQIQDRHADDPVSRSRFLVEGEITGGLEHPGIVPVYALGQYADGRPFYAMRFIRGDSLKDAIERYHQADQSGGDPGERALAFRQLLRRFLDVCNAIAYAHSRGVLHRDLKPGNIMLGKYGETLVVDWGLAKALDQPESNADSPEGVLKPASATGSAPTQMGSAIGTPQYMSPEQAAGRLDLLGPASDVYSLGATLYALLTGRAPFEEPELGLLLQRVQRGEFRAPRQVNGKIAAALDAICVKAMALRPEDRYPSPRALADDIELWLADEPVTAYREPVLDRLRRWRRRHRTTVTAAAVLLVSAVVALSGGLFLLNRKQAEIIQERNAAQKARDQAQTVASFFQDQILAAPRPKGFEGGASPQVTLREVLDRAEPKIATTFAGQPELEAAVRHNLGVTYFFLGRYDAACAQGEKAYKIRLELFGPDHPDTVRSAFELAEHYNWAGEYDKSAMLYRDVMERGPRVLGPGNEDVLYAPLRLGSVLNNKGDPKEAETLLRQGIEVCKRTLGAEHHHTFCGQARLADVLASNDQAEEALALKRQTFEGRKRVLGEEAYDTILSMGELGTLLRQQGKLAEAEPILRRNLEIRIRVLGPEHTLALYAKHQLAFLLEAQGKLQDAEALHRQALEVWLRIGGPKHDDTLTCQENLASNLDEQGKFDQAETIYKQTVAIKRKVRGSQHSSTLDSMYFLAAVQQKQKKFAEAEDLYRQLIAANSQVYGPEHRATLNRKEDLASALESQGKLDEAESLFREVLAFKRKGTDAINVSVTLVELGEVLFKAGRPSDAAVVLREALEIREKNLPAGHWRIGIARSLVGTSLLKQDKFDDAELLLLDGYEVLTKAKDAPPERVTEALDRLIEMYEKWGKPEKAEAWRKKRLPTGQ